MVRIVWLAALLYATLCGPLAAEGKRVALIIGMGEYQHLSTLANPVPDAKAIAAALKAHGFEVSENYNLDRASLLDALHKHGLKVHVAAMNDLPDCPQAGGMILMTATYGDG